MLASLAVGCSSGTEPTSAFDATSLVAEMSSSTSQTQGVTASLATQGVTASLPAPTAAGCAYSASSQSFVCPSVTMNGMTITMSYFLYDASGHSLSVLSKTSVDAIRTVMDMSGTTTPMRADMSGSISMTRHQDQTMSGLLSGNHVISGTASATMSGTMMMSGSSLSMSSTEADTTLNLVPPAAGGSAHYPQSGTQIMNQTTTMGSQGTFGVRTAITFHSDGTATAVTTIAGQTHTCTINLASPTLAPSCS